MADNRFNQVPGFGGGGFQVGPQNAAVHGMPGGMAPYMQTGMPMNPMMQQQMMMSPGMRFPMQGIRMGHPNTPPPPYNAHALNPGVPIRPRQTLNKTKGGQKSEKERFFEEQRQKLKQFGKPGAAKVNPDELIGSMFAAEAKPAQPRGKVSSKQTKEEDEDDGFGDFLQGPTVVETDSKTEKVEPLEVPEPEPEHPEEKKDLKSIMLEYSDLSAPKKAKGFHKPTLNEVQKTGHGHHKVAAPSFHQSDHSRSWKQHTEDLEGLFQIPVAAAPPPPAAPVSQAPHVVYAPQQMMGVGMPPAAGVVGYPQGPVLVPPSGPPPAYTDVAGSPSPALPNTTVVPSNHDAVAGGHPSPTEPTTATRGPAQLPEWCTYNEDQVPPVYRQVLEASLVDNKISTERLYPILLLSGLPREKLAHIWSICNTATPGQLVKHELWQVLALIALTQNNFDTSSPVILARCPVPPIPVFQYAQDTSSPATLTTTPQQHQVHPVHQPPTSVIAATNTAHQIPPSPEHPPQLQQQNHQIQQPSVAPAATSEDDDFADFQAAPPSATVTTTAVVGSKDEGYGEFIGGGGLTNSGFPYTPPPTLPTHNHQMGNGSVVIGNDSCQNAHHHQQHQQHEQPLSLASLPVDDKYGTNVRSFFCSSDSSTGHTSPSFEDDDFTDGRDSLSQVSTSEQSENEDIRNFENYVEEFNQKKEQPDASPLHCPFPAIQQNQGMKNSKGLQPGMVPPINDLKIQGKSATHVKLGTNNLTLSHGKGSKTNTLGLKGNITSSTNSSDPTNFKPRSESSMSSLAIPPAPSGKKEIYEEEDFADFKSASFQTDNNATASASNEVSLIGEEDKYGALRVLTLDNDIAQPSLFTSQDQTSTEDGNADENQDNDDDDWADFSAATSTGDSSESQFTSVTSSTATAAESSPGPNRSVSSKDDILKLFSAKPPPTFASGNSSDITSEGGSKNGSLFGDDISTASTPAKSQGLDSTLIEDQPSSSSYSEHDPPIVVPDWNKSGGDVSDDWAAFGSESISGPDKSSGSIFPPVTDPKDNAFGISKVNTSLSSHEGSTTTLGFQSLPSGLKNTPNTTDEWGSFSHTVSSSGASDTLSGIDFPRQPPEDDWGNFSHSAEAISKSEDDKDDWCDFSAAGENEGGDEAGDFVTIKKQNLGTNEIMGLFKVRDDPATLSSYQLPPQPPATKNTPKQSRSSHRSSGSEGPGRNSRRISSDFDDDLGPPPMDFGHDDDDDDHAFSRGYDLGDIMHRAPPATTYSPFGLNHASPLYSKAGGTSNTKVKESKEDTSSIHSLDLPSTRPSDPYGSDSQSVSSADLTSSEMTGGGTGAVSAESKSLDSLDLKADVASNESSNGQKEETTGTTHHHPIQPQELLASMPDFADKYNIEREAQGSDRYGHEWERCLVNCCQVISEANTLFNTISSSSVCSEVLKSSQGSEYVTSVIEIYRVVCRVMTSMRSTAISTTELEQTLKNIDLAWNNLTAFLVGASLLPDQSSLVFTNCVLKSDSDHAQNLACGVCLLSVDSKSLATSSAPNFNACKLTYAGRQYHATCANFWVNRVDQTLPSLTLPELF